VLISGAEIEGLAPRDVRIRAGRIQAIEEHLTPAEGEIRIEASGGALLPGLHDHHLHLFALAAEERSVRCGPPHVEGAADLARNLAGATPHDGWIRGIGYHESIAGELDRSVLDAWVPETPLRIQHRSGALWIVNSAGADKLGLDRGADPEGIERGSDGSATGRLFRMDAWLRGRTGGSGPPDLGNTSRRLASFGVTGVTDATASNGEFEFQSFASSADRGELLQRVTVMGSAELPNGAHPHISRGPVKFVLDESNLPRFDDFCGAIAGAHESGRAAAFHCVTRAELVLAAGALAEAGSRTGDRIEHAGIAPPDALEALRELGLTVVTQPNFIRERGDAYRRDVASEDRPWLYRAAGLIEASIPVGGGTDAPFGEPNPWLAAQAAVDRKTRDGAILGPDERLTPERALALFTSHAHAPGGPSRRVSVGSVADLCLIDRPWSLAREELSDVRVVAAIRGGEIIR